MKSEEKKSVIKCGYCHKQFKYESEKKRHEESHTPQFQCKICMKKFSFLSALRRHEKQHDRVEDVWCSECNHKFRDEALLKRHMNYAHKGTYICSKCNAKFNSDIALRTHLKTHKPVSERRYRCNHQGCNKSFNFQHHLKHHEMTHTNTKQYFCNICCKGFIQLHHLKTHIKTHTMERLQCTVPKCNKNFTHEYARKRHLATHTTTIDSGISSSDSNSECETFKMKVEESTKCSSSQTIVEDQMQGYITVERKNINHLQNLPTPSFQESYDSAAPQDLSVRSVKEETFRIDDFRSCKSVLGGCIVSANGEVNENCLCAQMTTTDTQYDLIPNENPSELGNNFDKGANAEISEKRNICEGCACNPNESIKSVPSKSTCSKYRSQLPEFEYCIDGTIKIKETFDTDIDIAPRVDEINEGKKDLWQFNSCKSVLGKCIATESGKISDGCLCARMALDDTVNAEEIDEITPQPRVN